MKTYKQTRQGTVFHNVDADTYFSKLDPEYKTMVKEKKEGLAVVLPFSKAPTEKRRNRYLSIPQAEINEALLDFLLWEKADKLQELKAKFDNIKKEFPKAAGAANK